MIRLHRAIVTAGGDNYNDDGNNTSGCAPAARARDLIYVLCAANVARQAPVGAPFGASEVAMAPAQVARTVHAPAISVRAIVLTTRMGRSHRAPGICIGPRRLVSVRSRNAFRSACFIVRPLCVGGRREREERGDDQRGTRNLRTHRATSRQMLRQTKHASPAATAPARTGWVVGKNRFFMPKITCKAWPSRVRRWVAYRSPKRIRCATRLRPLSRAPRNDGWRAPDLPPP
jgi:hypothetical protein